MTRAHPKRPLRQTSAYAERKRRKEWDRIALLALEMDLPIFERMEKIGAGSDALNRHAALHGQSLTYGTLTNSLKAISLLNYVAFGADTGAAGDEDGGEPTSV